MKKRFQIFIPLILTLSLLQSCDNSSDNDDPAPVVNTPSETPPAPTPPPVTPPVTPPPVNPPTSRVLWTKIITHHVTDTVVEGQCEYPWKLTIYRSGNFSGGLCLGEKITGRLTRNELAELDRRADLVAEDIDDENICQEISPMTEEHFSISVPGEGTEKFYEASTIRGICYHGGIQDAQNLRDYLLNSILAKYYHPPEDND